MEPTRVRFALLEWLCAALLMVAGVVAVAFAIGNGHRVTVVPMTPVMAREAPVPDPPAVLHAGAVSVPMLPVLGGHTLRVGARASELRRLLGGVQRGADVVDRDGTRDRVTRLYDIAGTTVAVVLEAPQPGAEPLVVAIYR
jgi:hypothetical protein